MEMIREEEPVKMKEGEFTEPVLEEVKPEGDKIEEVKLEEKMPSESKSDEMGVIAVGIVPEPSVEAVTSDPIESKPEA